MSDFKILFSNPWLLLLLIPAIAVPLFLYFRISKKYRRTRNRVTSLVLHLVIMVLSIAVLSGMTFNYNVANTENEVLILVDMSFSGKDTENSKNEFVRSVINASSTNFQVGVVTFGYGQVYAAPLTNDTDKIYQQYLNADLPDISATDIASALNYAGGLFAHPETAKIVLVTDGLETDGNALSAVKSIAASGIKVDTAFFPTDFADDVQLIDVTTPDYNIIVGDMFNMTVTLQSSYSGSAYITLYDNDVPSTPVLVDLKKGVQTVDVSHTFNDSDVRLHKISFEINSNGDNLTENNEYHSYIYLHVFDKILVIENYEQESEKLKELLINDEYNVTVVSSENVPSTLEELREFDQVILSNVANADLPEGFDEILHSYVYDIGGGLFTVGGNQLDDAGNTIVDVYGNPVANAYNRNDLHNDDGSATLLQRMLPVQAVNYTPPLGLAIIIDASGSMGSGDNSTGTSKLEAAKQGAMACLQVLTERDSCGVFALSDKYSEEIEITPMTNMSKIVTAIDSISGGGGTNFAPAIEYAGKALGQLDDVERRHIILITDGQPGDSKEKYCAQIANNYEYRNITMSIVSIGTLTGTSREDMREAAEDIGHGKFYVGDANTLVNDMIDDLKLPAIKEVEYGEFTPKITGNFSVTNGINQEDMPYLYGFYGTKLKSDAEAPLMGEYVPVYAQWKYGRGMVGSFMCDLNGTWSMDFLTNAVGQRFLSNVVKTLFPLEDIRAKNVEVEIKEDNYTTQLSIYTSLQEGETLTVKVTSPQSADDIEPPVQTFTAGAKDSYSRLTFTNILPGVYEITIEKKDAQGNVTGQYSGYKTFSYSKEFNVFFDPIECQNFVDELAQYGNGKKVEDIMDVYSDVVKELNRTIDPRLIFIILAIILFLLDIAVRKFKFKWPHEIVRERKEKKAQNKQ